MIVEKMANLRLLTLFLGLTEPILYRNLGSNWKLWHRSHLSRLEELIEERKRKLHNAFGDQLPEAQELAEILDAVMEKVWAAHNSVGEEMRERLRKGPQPAVKFKESLASAIACSERDINLAAKELGVIKERRPTGKRVEIWWSLPDGE